MRKMNEIACHASFVKYVLTHNPSTASGPPPFRQGRRLDSSFHVPLAVVLTAISRFDFYIKKDEILS